LTPSSHHRQVPADYPRLIELVRIAEALSRVRAEIITVVDGHALVVASLGRNVLQPRGLTFGEQRLAETSAGHAVSEHSLSVAARGTDGRLLAVLTMADDVQAIAVDGLYGVARLIAEVFADRSTEDQGDFHRALIDSMRDPVIVMDTEFVMRYASDGVSALLGRSPVELIGASAADFIHPEDLLVAADTLGRLAGGREVYRETLRIRHASGEYVRIEVTGNDRSFDPLLQGLVLCLRSGDRDLELADELERERSLLSAVLDQMQEGVVATDQVGVPTIVNQAARSLHRIARDATADSIQLTDLPLWDAELLPVAVKDHPANRVRAGEHIAGQPYSIYADDGSVRHVIISGRPVVNARGEQVAATLAYHDATQARQTEGDLRDRALHDPLTGLANRQQLADRLMRLAEPRNDLLIGLCFIDLDGFKRVNDTFGHAVGDEVLRSVARRLSAELRPSDLLARLGGDEFVAVLTGAPDRDAAAAIAERLRATIDHPFVIDGTSVTLSASLGIAISLSKELDPDRLLRNADLALYAAKANGKDRVEFFATDLASAADGQNRQVQFLRDCLTYGRLVMHFQPSVNVETGAVVGIEALARCLMTDGSLVGPSSFLTAAVASGLICELDRQAFDLSCAAAAALRIRVPRLQVPISCNFGSLSVSQPGFAAEVLRTIEQYGLDASQVCIEVTENTAFELAEREHETLRELSVHGVKLILDDFGTGYSSLAHIRNLPLAAVKVDPSLSSSIEASSSTDSAIARAFVKLADSLKLMVVAEGVESNDQLERAKALGFRVAQGYLYSPAIPLDDLILLLCAPSWGW
jgi:diguanylate cyclase (GGDEF)-like protein/PAS domain S-box-containing protein